MEYSYGFLVNVVEEVPCSRWFHACWEGKWMSISYWGMKIIANINGIIYYIKDTTYMTLQPSTHQSLYLCIYILIGINIYYCSIFFVLILIITLINICWLGLIRITKPSRIPVSSLDLCLSFRACQIITIAHELHRLEGY